MYVMVDGDRLYFDVEGAGLVAEGSGMREKPTLLLLHGGPGFDHTLFKPSFSALSDLVQIVYLEHRGNGRSEGRDPARWTLAQWGDDVKSVCDALGIDKPIVYGASFGGLVAQAHATRHPEHPGKLILASTAARYDYEVVIAAFGRRGGLEAEAVARDYLLAPTQASRARFLEACFPLYTASPGASPHILSRTRLRPEVAFHFNGPDREQGRYDFRAALARVSCPVLVMTGLLDPIMPPALSEEIVAALPAGIGELIRFEACGHGIVPDAPEEALAAIRAFIAHP
jgi:proline iminopeptidase